MMLTLLDNFFFNCIHREKARREEERARKVSENAKLEEERRKREEVVFHWIGKITRPAAITGLRIS